MYHRCWGGSRVIIGKERERGRAKCELGFNGGDRDVTNTSLVPLMDDNDDDDDAGGSSARDSLITNATAME